VLREIGIRVVRYSDAMNHARILVLCLAIGGLLSGCDRSTRDTDIKFISVSEAKTLFDRAQRGESGVAIFLDPRPAKEFDAGHIPGARHLTLAQVKPTSTPDPRIMKYSNLVVYGNDPASATARGLTKRLIEVRYGDVRFFAGGLEEWNQRNYPLERAETSPVVLPPPSP